MKEFKLKMIDETIKMTRKAKFIRRTLHAVCKDRSLTRKNISTLRNFFDNAVENLDLQRLLITNSILDDILLPQGILPVSINHVMEKQLFDDAIRILESGNRTIIDAFRSNVEALLLAVRMKKGKDTQGKIFKNS